ncbi:MAG: hypothetical protein ABSA75_08735 [Candidatus Bathyarchaeia archaeon]|jgi:hypothetical protein
MFTIKPRWTIRTGVFLIALSWFLFTFYEFINGILHNTHPGPGATTWLLLSDTAGGTGLAFRAVGGFIAVISALFYLVKRDLSEPEALTSLRFIVILEAAYWFSLVFSIIPSAWSPFNSLTIENNIPITVEAIVLPIVLAMLFINLSPKKASTYGLKWGLISGTTYIFVFWLNNACNWIAAVMIKNVDYVILYPANLFSFLFTTVGLLAITIFAAYFSMKTIQSKDITKLNLKRVGVIIIAFGLYFDIIFVMYLFLGAVGGWGEWYAWFFGHNMDLWLMALPMAGAPFLLQEKAQNPPATA